MPGSIIAFLAIGLFLLEVSGRADCFANLLTQPICLQTHLYNTDRAKEFFDGIFSDSGRKIGHKHLICLVFFSCKKIKSIIKKSVLL